MTPTLVVVVPIYNEADFIPTALPSLISTMNEVDVPYRVLLVENGSRDGTAEVAKRFASCSPVEIISLPDADYGAAMRTGFLEADGAWIVNFDIDYFSADFLRSVLNQPADVDLVIASKRDPASDDRRSPLRRIATFVFNLLLRSILASRVSDTHGMKGFRSVLITDLAPQVVSTQDLFDTELVVRAERAGYTIVEVPVTVEELRSAKSSLIKRAPRTVIGLLKIRQILKV